MLVDPIFESEPLKTEVAKTVAKIIASLDDASLQRLASYDESMLRMLHHGFGTHLRNTYDLWHTSPLTARWRSGVRDIKDGIDMSSDHPDAVSSMLIRLVADKARHRQ